MTNFRLFRNMVLSVAFFVLVPAHALSVSIPEPNSSRDPAKIYLPAQYNKAQKWPVILLLHGYAGNADIMDYYFGFSAQASARGFILIAPNGKVDSSGYRFWNASGACCDFDHSGVDDIGYLKGLLAQVEKSYSVDMNRVFVVGHSNGGFMAHSLACSQGLKLNAIISFAGTVTEVPESCAMNYPVSMLQIHAIDDDTIRFMGDPKGYPGLQPYAGAEETVDRWLKRDECAGAPQVGSEMSLTHDIPGNDTTPKTWKNCAGGSQVAFWVIKAYNSPLHFPHTPLLNNEFTERVLNFLLAR